MLALSFLSRWIGRILVCGSVLLAAGCHSVQHQPTMDPALVSAVAEETPRELYKTFLPPYIIEPPDILMIQAVTLTPKSPYSLRVSDVLSIQVPGAFADSPIQGLYPIQPGGLVDLGAPYGAVKVSGLTIEQARDAINSHLSAQVREPQAVVSLGQLATMQQIQGEHLVKPDGTVRLGTYGSVLVIGMTLDDAESAIEQHLSQFLDEPDISVDVFAFNSKSYYVILQGAGLGDQLVKYPFTGNETVLDAISQFGGLTQASSNKIWIARPGPNFEGGCKILPVDYESITRCGDIATNYQLLPGDRLYVEQDHLVALDTRLGKVFAPLERIMGFSLLGVNTVSRFSGPVLKGGGTRNQNFGGF